MPTEYFKKERKRMKGYILRYERNEKKDGGGIKGDKMKDVSHSGRGENVLRWKELKRETERELRLHRRIYPVYIYLCLLTYQRKQT